MSKKFSDFTVKDIVADSDYVNVTGSGVNRRVAWPDFLDNIYDRIVTPFIYPTVVALQEAPLRADEDDPVYVRVEETEYRLYKITNIAPGEDDIALENGNTATAQTEYRDIGFVVGPETSSIGALATYDNETGTLLAEGPTPSTVGVNLIEFPDSSSDGFLRKKNDNTLELLTGDMLKDFLNLENVDNTSDLNKPISTATQAALDLKASITYVDAADDDLQEQINDRIQSVATIADLRLVTGVSVGQIFNVNGIGTFEAVAGTFADDGQLYVETGNGVICKILNARITGNATVTVPTYYATIQAALDDLYPRVIFDTSHTVSINIETGHALTAGFRIDNGDYSGFVISSTDATVFLDPAFTPVSTTDLDPGVPRTVRNAFVAVRAKMPKWNIKVDMTGPAIANGYTLLYGSHGYVVSYMGVINTSDSPSSTGGVNCRVAGSSQIDAYRAAFDGANDTGISVTQNSRAQIAEATATNCGETGLDVSRGSDVYANLINVSGSKEGIYIRRSTCVAQLANLNACTSVGLWAALGSKVIISDSTFDDPAPSLNRIRIEDGSNVSATGCTKNGSALVASDTNVSLFNQSTGNGIIYNQASPVASIPALHGGSTAVQIVSADNQSIATLTYQTIFDLTGSMVLYGGTIYGNDVGFRLTVDGTVVASDVTRARGVDSAGEFLSICSIPPAIATSTMKLEAYNRSGGTAALGWKIYKQGGV